MITYQESLEGVRVEQLRGGFFVGWPNPPAPEAHYRILAGSAAIVLALNGDEVVGFITAISDGVCSAYISPARGIASLPGPGGWHGTGAADAGETQKLLYGRSAVRYRCAAILCPARHASGQRDAATKL
jgi:hypothetical protein